MLDLYDNYVFEVKGNTSKIRNILAICLIASVALSIFYFAYWIFLMSDDYIYDYTVRWFYPLAHLLFPNDSSYEVYKSTSFVLLALAIPFFMGFEIADTIEDKLLRAHQKQLEFKEKIKTIKAKQDYKKQFDEIQQYSICLSIDYLPSENISEIAKRRLNQVVFSKLNDYISSRNSRIKLSISDVFIMTSYDFIGYDKVYDSLLEYLAKTKIIIGRKYGLHLIPSITTDAYKNANRLDMDSIKQSHFDIQSFDFKNKACSTNLFSKKYSHMTKNKYMGVPIGEYVVFKNETQNTYELNMVYKNLSKALAAR